MKRMYVRPAVMVDLFNTTNHVSACAWDMKTLSLDENCVAIGDEEDYNNPPIAIFNAKNTACEIDVQDYDAFCYTTSAEGWTIFVS